MSALALRGEKAQHVLTKAVEEYLKGQKYQPKKEGLHGA
jgi:hypothetical protein